MIPHRIIENKAILENLLCQTTTTEFQRKYRTDNSLYYPKIVWHKKIKQSEDIKDNLQYTLENEANYFQKIIYLNNNYILFYFT